MTAGFVFDGLSADRLLRGGAMTPSVRDAPAQPLPSRRQLASDHACGRWPSAAALLVTVVLPGGVRRSIRSAPGRALGLTAACRRRRPRRTSWRRRAGVGAGADLDGPIAHYPGAVQDRHDAVRRSVPTSSWSTDTVSRRARRCCTSWTGTAAVIHDFHGEPQTAGRATPPVSYEKEDAARRQRDVHRAVFGHPRLVLGESLAPRPITVTLTTAGFYSSAIEIRSDRTRKSPRIEMNP